MQGNPWLLVLGFAAGGHVVGIDNRHDGDGARRDGGGACLMKRGREGMKLERRDGPLGAGSGARQE
jgi:hypothetical protein